MIRFILLQILFIYGCRENHACRCAYVTATSNDSAVRIVLLHGSQVSAEQTCTAIERAEDGESKRITRKCEIK